MTLIEVLLPRMGESITEATITRWLKKPGEFVEFDEPIVEIATDKVDSEIPSPAQGVISKLLFDEGQVAEVGQALALIDTTHRAPEVVKKPTPLTADSGNSSPNQQSAPELNVGDKIVQPIQKDVNKDNRYYSPLVRQMASSEGITLAELQSIKGSGRDNRVTKNDLLDYITYKQKHNSEKTNENETVSQTSYHLLQEIPVQNRDTLNLDKDVIEISRMRKIIMNHMVMSQNTSVHVTSVIETDVSQLVRWRETNKAYFLDQYDIALTYMPAFVWCIAQTLKEFPVINSSIAGDNIIIHKRINIGIATALPDGNLIVPVLKNADKYNLAELAKKINDLAKRARSNGLEPDETQGGTFTITNIGSIGTLFATPIINQPQVAILATGAITKKPVVVELPLGDTIAIRNMMYLSMSYDHRIIDGALGGVVLNRIGEFLRNWDINQKI